MNRWGPPTQPPPRPRDLPGRWLLLVGIITLWVCITWLAVAEMLR